MWTKEKLEERAKVLFNSEWVAAEQNEKNQQSWVKAVTSLGSNWKFTQMVQRAVK